MSFFCAHFLCAFEKIACMCMGFSMRFSCEFRAKYLSELYCNACNRLSMCLIC